MNQAIPINVTPDVQAGAAGYNPRLLASYDQIVHNFSSRFLWKCPTSELVDLYNQNVSAKHLDIGVATGYFLDTCRFPSATPELILADLNTHCLTFAAQRLQRYSPRTIALNILDPLPDELGSVDSIGLTYVLHCLPGPMSRKAAALRNVKKALSKNGVLFGATVLGQGVPLNLGARAVMALYNHLGSFSNRNDKLEELESALRSEFREVDVRMVGCVALFVARP